MQLGLLRTAVVQGLVLLIRSENPSNPWKNRRPLSIEIPKGPPLRRAQMRKFCPLLRRQKLAGSPSTTISAKTSVQKDLFVIATDPAEGGEIVDNLWPYYMVYFSFSYTLNTPFKLELMRLPSFFFLLLSLTAEAGEVMELRGARQPRQRPPVLSRRHLVAGDDEALVRGRAIISSPGNCAG